VLAVAVYSFNYSFDCVI